MDQAITWSLVAVWIVAGLVGARKRFPEAAASEAYLLAASRAVFTLSLVIGSINLIGLVFMVWLKISSLVWFFWELFFLTSVIAVFWIAPVLCAVLLGWALVGRQSLHHSPRALMMTARALAGIVADVLVYYAIQVSIAYQSSAVNAG
jgi:hypothetical protein